MTLFNLLPTYLFTSNFLLRFHFSYILPNIFLLATLLTSSFFYYQLFSLIPTFFYVQLFFFTLTSILNFHLIFNFQLFLKYHFFKFLFHFQFCCYFLTFLFNSILFISIFFLLSTFLLIANVSVTFNVFFKPLNLFSLPAFLFASSFSFHFQLSLYKNASFILPTYVSSAPTYSPGLLFLTHSSLPKFLFQNKLGNTTLNLLKWAT